VTPGAGNNPANSAFVANLRAGTFGQGNLYRTGTGHQMPQGLTLDPATGLLSGTPLQSGTYNIVLECYNALGQTATQSFTLRIAPEGGDFDSWVAGYPGLADTSATGDPDRDGIANMIEYYLGLRPDAHGSSGIIISNSAPGLPSTLSMIYTRSNGVTGVNGSVVWSSVLANTNSWTTNGVVETVVDKGDYEEVTATVTNAPDETRKFLRLRVTQP
jgi:hypothetical protein